MRIYRHLANIIALTWYSLTQHEHGNNHFEFSVGFPITYRTVKYIQCGVETIFRRFSLYLFSGHIIG